MAMGMRNAWIVFTFVSIAGGAAVAETRLVLR